MLVDKINSVYWGSNNLFAVSSIEAIKSKNTSVFSIGGRKIQSLSSLISTHKAVLTKAEYLLKGVVEFWGCGVKMGAKKIPLTRDV